MFDIGIDHRERFSAARRAQYDGRTLRQQNVDPAVVPPLLIIEARRQVHGVFIGQKTRLLHKRFVLVIERIVHEVVFQKTARPQPGHQQADVSCGRRCDVKQCRCHERKRQSKQPPIQEKEYEARRKRRTDARPRNLFVLHARRTQAREAEQHDGKELRVENGAEQSRRSVEVHQDFIDHADIHSPREDRLVTIPIDIHHDQ